MYKYYWCFLTLLVIEILYEEVIAGAAVDGVQNGGKEEIMRTWHAFLC